MAMEMSEVAPTNPVEEGEEKGWAVKFIPFSSSIESPFWVKYCQEKLDTIQLNEDPIAIRPTYGVDQAHRVQCQESSLQGISALIPNERISVNGQLIGFNTVEALQKVDKNQLLHDFFCPKFFAGDVDCLTSCLLLTYADLKNHKVLYWFGFPALLIRPGKSIRAVEQERLGDIRADDETNPCSFPNLATQMEAMRLSLLVDRYKGLPSYFVFSKSSCCLPLSKESYATIKAHDEEIVFGFIDSSASSSASGTPLAPEQAMGWPMRNLVAYLCFHLDLGGQTVRLLSYRPKRLRRLTLRSNEASTKAEEMSSTPAPIADTQGVAHSKNINDDDSIVIKIKVPVKEDYEFEVEGASAEATKLVTKEYKVVGWELNARNKPGPRWVNLRPLLDSHHLAIQAADLNLKLMKWRMIPNLQVEHLQATKVLLIGAGTLGCNVARVLLGWGIRKFKIVDNGKVSYSNPVRQSLFTLDDCRDDSGSGKHKAVAAASALKQIAADVDSEGIVLSIPMPGHTENKESIQAAVETLDTLVKQCDVVFLLTDTRESRWLPTVMAAAHDKILINAALGLDSWLVIRHGGGFSSDTRYGCYFCNDVVAPENSTRNRTLDQQCTVTRPGLAPIASAMAAEMMVALLHHPDGSGALAPIASSNFSPTMSHDVASSSRTELGVIPHQIRGSLVSYTMMTPTVPAFCHCTACSALVVNAYSKDKMELVEQACRSVDGSFLEALSGLTKFRADATDEIDGIADWDEDDD